MNALSGIKLLLTATIIMGASELAKKSVLAATLLLALPLTSVLSLLWIYIESGDRLKLADISWSIFWLVPPSLVFFPIFAILVKREISFWLVLAIAAGLTLVVYLIYAKILGLLNIKF